MKKALNQTELKIVELVHAIDIITGQMNSLMPIDVNNDNLEKFKEMYNYREDLHFSLYNTTNLYIKDKAVEQEMNKEEESKNEDVNEDVNEDENTEENAEIDWKRVALTLQGCMEALDLLEELRDQKKITSEQKAILTSPLSAEIQNIHRFTIGRLLKMEKECLKEGALINPLIFNI